MQDTEHGQTPGPRTTAEIAHGHIFAEEGNFYQSRQFQTT
jgi:hypothetical protein